MHVGGDRIGEISKAIVHEVRAERVTFMAGSLAYNAFLSLLPLLFLLLALVSSLGSGDTEQALIELTRSVITPGAARVLSKELTQASVSISVLGVGILVWGALRIFRNLDLAFSDIYESEEECTIVSQIVDGVTVLVCLIGVVAAVVFVESRVGLGGAGTAGWVVARAVLFVAISVALLPMFYLFPDEPDHQVREAVPGTLFAAFGLMSLQSLFGLYVEFSSTQAQNSILASIIVFLTYLYCVALVILIAGAINAVLTNRSEDIDIDPIVVGYAASDSAGTDRVDDEPSAHSESLSHDRTIDDDAGIPEAQLQHLEALLRTPSSLTVTVDGTNVALPAPDRTEVDLETSSVPFLDETGHIELHWRPAEEE